MQIYVGRFKPNTDLKQEIIQFAKNKNIKAGCILTCVGSLKQASLRFANQQESVCLKEYFEVIALTGTVSAEEGVHLHIGISNNKGQMLGGHLMDGTLIYTTIELAIIGSTEFIFYREVDETYGYRELVINERK